MKINAQNLFKSSVSNCLRYFYRPLSNPEILIHRLHDFTL